MLFTLHIYQYRMEKTGKGGSKYCLFKCCYDFHCCYYNHYQHSNITTVIIYLNWIGYLHPEQQSDLPSPHDLPLWQKHRYCASAAAHTTSTILILSQIVLLSSTFDLITEEWIQTCYLLLIHCTRTVWRKKLGESINNNDGQIIYMLSICRSIYVPY